MDFTSESQTLQNLNFQGKNALSDAFNVREILTEYFNSDAGSLLLRGNILM